MSSDHQRGDMYVYWTRRARGYTPGGGVWNEHEYIVLSLIREWTTTSARAVVSRCCISSLQA